MITNSTPLIIFSKINKLDLLPKVFADIIIIPEAVFEEVVEKGIKLNAPDTFLIKDFIEKQLITIKKLNKEYKKKSEFLSKAFQIGKGESETISLALQENEKTVIIDDKKARKVAKLYSLKPKGSLRIILSAFKNKIINEEEVKFLITEMTSSKFRLSSELINKFWILFEKLKK